MVESQQRPGTGTGSLFVDWPDLLLCPTLLPPHLADAEEGEGLLAAGVGGGPTRWI